jgi:hypothetical protein
MLIALSRAENGNPAEHRSLRPLDDSEIELKVKM